MRFADLSALRSFDEDFPRTKQRASRTFDFPEPFGPRTQLRCSPKTISVCFAKLLKPSITMRVMRVVDFGCWSCKEDVILGCTCTFSSSIKKLCLGHYLKVFVGQREKKRKNYNGHMLKQHMPLNEKKEPLALHQIVLGSLEAQYVMGIAMDS